MDCRQFDRKLTKIYNKLDYSTVTIKVYYGNSMVLCMFTFVGTINLKFFTTGSNNACVYQLIKNALDCAYQLIKNALD